MTEEGLEEGVWPSPVTIGVKILQFRLHIGNKAATELFWSRMPPHGDRSLDMLEDNAADAVAEILDERWDGP